MKAKALEAKPKNPTLPNAPKGAHPSGALAALDGMSDDQFSRLPPEERSRLLVEADAARRAGVA